MSERDGASAEAGLAEGNLALRLEELRRAAGLSQEALSRRMADEGVPMPQSAISRIEKPGDSGRRAITVDEALAMARIFRQDIRDLLLSPEAEVLGRLQNAHSIQAVLDDAQLERDRSIELLLEQASGSPWWQDRIAQEAEVAYKRAVKDGARDADQRAWRFFKVLLLRWRADRRDTLKPALQRMVDTAGTSHV